ncbi:site-specific integrase [Candidatus Gottesmanbacteria bacterium]|nr:site-specific integrase [Candidatus Gottesmanbacteria bacterium]
MKLKNLKPIHIAQYQEHLKRDLKLSPKSIARKLSSLKKFLNWAYKNNFISLDYIPDASVGIPTLRRDSSQNASLLDIDSLSVFSSNNPPPKDYYNISENINSVVVTKWPFVKKLFFHLKNTRPAWYKKYHSISVVHYFHFAILAIFVSFIGFGLYQQLFTKVPTPFANPPATTNVIPNRIISFQGRLTDSSSNPITSGTNIRFGIYNSLTASGSALLWQELDYVDPDENGIFNILLGQSNSIASTLFSENASLWLGLTVANDPEATPRQQIATVPYALNSEMLQGHPPSASVSANQIPVMTQNGDFYIAQNNPRIFSASGGFTIQGQTLTISTQSNGNITINPQGSGRTLIYSATTDSNTLDIKNASITTGNMIYAYAGNDNSGYNLLRLTSGSSEVNRFLVDQSGNTSASGDLIVGAVDTTPNISTRNLKSLTLGNSTTGAIILAPGATTALTAYSDDVTIADTLSVYGTTIGLNNDADSNNLIGIAAASGIAASDLYWGNDLVCDVSETNCGWATSTTTYWTRDAGNVYPATVNDTVSATSSAATVATFTATGSNNALRVGSNTNYLLIDASGNITSNLTTLTIDAGGTVDVTDVLNANSITSDAGVSIAASQSYTGSGAVSLTSADTTTLTVDSGTTGGLNIGTGSNAKTITLGNTTTSTALNFDTGTGGINFGDNANTKTIDIGGVTNSGTDTINISTNSTAADVITIGNSNTSTTLALTGGDDWSINTAGLAILGSTLSVYGNTIGLNNDADSNNLIGIAAAAGVSASDLYWGNDLVCDVSETNCGWVAGTSQANYWIINNGTIYPVNSTVDFLVGGTATSSAKFAVLNVDSGTPVASVSAGVNGASYLTAGGILSSTNMLPVVIGSSTTGSVQLAPKGTTGLFVNGSGLVGIGTTTPDQLLDLSNAAPRMMFLETGVTADNANWRIGVDAEQFVMQTRDDAGIVTANFMAVNRTGTTIDSVAFDTSAIYFDTNNNRIGIGSTGPTVAFDSSTADSSSTTVLDSILLTRTNNSGAGAAGLGTAIDFYLETATSGTNNQAARIDAVWEDATAGSADSSIRFNTNVDGTLTEAMRIDDGGNVGIGNTAPTEKLMVTGNASISGTLTIGPNTLRSSTGPLALAYKSALDTWTSGITLRDISGNVGIGTTYPSTFVRVEKDQNALTSLSVSNTTADTAAFTNVSIEAGNSSGQIGAFSSGYTTLNSAVADSFRVRSNSTASNGLNLVTGASAPIGFWINDAEKMRIDTGGNVGIGLTAPLLRLHVTDSQSATASAMIENTDTGTDADGLAVKLGFTASVGGSCNTGGGACNEFITFLDGNGNKIGKIHATSATAVLYKTSGADYAEGFQKQNYNEEFLPGEVVSIGNDGAKVVKSNSEYNNKLVGVITDNAGFAGGYEGEDSVMVGLLGQVKVKINPNSPEILEGDLITSSNSTGKAMKADKPGITIGKALEKWKPGSGKDRILVFVDPSWSDPTIALNEDGVLVDKSTQEVIYTKVTSQEVNSLRAFITNLVSNIISAREVNVEDKLVSPVIEAQLLSANTVQTDLIRPITDQIEIDGDASVSGTLYAGRIVSDEVVTEKVTVVERIQEVIKQIVKEDQTQELFAETAYQASSSGTLSYDEIIALINEANQPDQEYLPSESFGDIDADNLSLAQNLYVFGQTNLSDAFVTGTITQGLTFQITGGNSINVLNGTLYIQNLGGPLDLMAGKITIDSAGNTHFVGNVSIAGNLNVNSIKTYGGDLLIDLSSTSSGGFGGLLVKGNIKNEGDLETNKLTATEASISGQLIADSLKLSSDLTATNSGLIIASSQTASESGILAPSIKTNGTTGVGILPAGETEVVVFNNSVSNTKLIYLTPTSETLNKVLYVKAKKAPTSRPEASGVRGSDPLRPSDSEASQSVGNENGDGFFVVALDSIIDRDVTFNWWIIN